LIVFLNFFFFLSLSNIQVNRMNILSSDPLPDNNNKVNIKEYMVDPLSVIIKLAILSNKPVGTKILIYNNVLYFQEPGMFQSMARYFYNTNKTDLQYMHNPIQHACSFYLSKDFVQKTPRIKSLFQAAQNGIKKLMETYKSNSVICLALNYFHIIINNHLEQIYNETIFQKDAMTVLFTKDLLINLQNLWTQEKIKVILDLITFLTNDKSAAANVKSLENIMENNDKETAELIKLI
jgi:hypothetical protein